MASAHNAAPQHGVAPNPDPALDITREHQHEHVHHAPSAQTPTNVVYTSHTTQDHSIIADQNTAHDANLHRRSGGDRKNSNGSLGIYEKNQNLDINDAEKGSSIPDASRDHDEEKKEKGKFALFYAKYRIFFRK